jgi:indole-3-glycerol phosphate synthase
MKDGVLVIAEVKTQSPFGYRSRESFEELFQIAERVGDIISIHTDPRWGGSFELIRRARTMTGKPILAKGWHTTDEQVERAFRCGADWVLAVGMIPRLNAERCLIEPLSLQQLREIPNHLRAVWNSRDLYMGGLKKETFQEAREVFKGWLCQASNIKTVADIEPGADAILVGTHLVEFAASL